jgi:hypothetical protein
MIVGFVQTNDKLLQEIDCGARKPAQEEVDLPRVGEDREGELL